MEALANVQLTTNEVRIKNNNLPNGQYAISPNFTRKTGQIDDNNYFTELSIEISDKKEARFPIDLYISITGVFDLINYPKEQREDFLKIQAIQIMFPYIRSMVSNITASSLMVPIIIPIIDVKKLFHEDVNVDSKQ